ncbi:MAG: hypothetical protein C4521_00720 [Actinobacteria bacterium]|nr:MAG: hypothetical protein C4521_00720 [Actinomycetota bacterium]
MDAQLEPEQPVGLRQETLYRPAPLLVQIVAWILGALALLALLSGITFLVAIAVGEVEYDPLDIVSVTGSMLLSIAAIPSALGLWKGRSWGLYSTLAVLAVQVPQIVTPLGRLAVYLFVELNFHMGYAPDIAFGVNIVPVVIAALVLVGHGTTKHQPQVTAETPQEEAIGRQGKT